jgi:hypothetical protein
LIEEWLTRFDGIKTKDDFWKRLSEFTVIEFIYFSPLFFLLIKVIICGHLGNFFGLLFVPVFKAKPFRRFGK